MKKIINTKMISCLLAVVFALGLSFSANAKNAELQEAKEEISRLEEENASLKQELEIYENKIAKHRARLEEADKIAMELKAEQ